MPVPVAYKEPSEASGTCFDDVPGVEGVHDGFYAERAAFVLWWRAGVSGAGCVDGV